MPIDYSHITGEMFANELERQIEGMPAYTLLGIPGVYDLLSEYLNNDILEALGREVDAPPFDQLTAAIEAGGPILISGAQGSGKTSLALRAIEALGPAATTRPFRAPHHTVSVDAMIDEIDLAAHGVLLLDEADQFRPGVVDAALAYHANFESFTLIATVCVDDEAQIPDGFDHHIAL